MVAGGPKGLTDESGNPDCPWFGQADENCMAEIGPLFGSLSVRALTSHVVRAFT